MSDSQPLRRVLKEVPYEILTVDGRCTGAWNFRELLECGHLVRVKTDFYGQTHATRRRCRKCRDGLPPDWTAPLLNTQIEEEDR